MPQPPAPCSALDALTAAELRARCRRALFAGARPGFRGPRAELRRAVRRFLCRHRRDRGALLQALRAAALSSSLVLALLGLSRPAGADYVERSGAANPLPSFDVGSLSTPTLADIDGDGDLDLFSGQSRGYGGDGFRYWENTGSAADPAFLTRTGSRNPLAGFRVTGGFDYGRSTPAFADLDGDGDLDATSGDYYFGLHYFENVGSAASPAFVERTGSANPFGGLGSYPTGAPAFVDLDGDSDLDVVVGGYFGSFSYLENTGTATSPIFASRTGSQNPLAGLATAEYYATPAFGDLDGDGDLDLAAGMARFLGGGADGTFAWFENTGSATGPAFLQRTGSQNPLDAFDVGNWSAPALADLDADGVLDVVSGEADGGFVLFENTGSTTAPALAEQSGTGSPFHGFSVGYESAPALADLDADGDLDTVSGSHAGGLAFFENTGSAGSPAFADRTGSQNPFAGFDAGFHSTPALADLDGDGDLDLVSGRHLGTFAYLLNTGSAAAPAFLELTSHALSAFLVGSRSTPALGDLDGDGDVDLVSGRSAGSFAYLENTGTAAAAAFVERTGSANPLDGLGTFSLSAPTLVDADGDGDLDVFSARGGRAYFENTGAPTAPAFLERTGPESPFAGITAAPSPGSAALGDLDADGDLDAIAGESFGRFLFFENAADLTRRYFARTGSTNPLGGFDVGAFSSPVFADIDADGDLDAFSGAQDGSFFHFENTGTAGEPAFQQRSGSENPLSAFSVPGFSVPLFADIDGDGDLDAFSGEGLGPYGSGGVHYYENTGTATSPAFTERTGSANPLAGVSDVLQPSFADLDGDGDLDLVARELQAPFRYYENTGSATSPAFVRRFGGALHPLAGIDAGDSYAIPSPVLIDLDGDGDSDLVSGSGGASGFRYWENTGTATSPAFVPAPSPLQGLGQGTYVFRPTFADIDADGDLDAFFAHADGSFAFFENAPPVSVPLPWWVPLGAALGIGGLALRRRGVPRAGIPAATALLLLAGATPARADFVQRGGADNPLPGFDVGDLSTPAFADIDGDGDLDLFSGGGTSNAGKGGDGFFFFENTGAAGSPALVPRTGTGNPLAGFRVEGGGDWGRSAPALADLDGDGDLDAISGQYDASFVYFENTGSAAAPVFLLRTGTASPLDGLDLFGFTSTPALADLDADGDLDLLSGTRYAGFGFFENTGSATAPAFVQRTGSQNPLSAFVASYGAPAFADLDDDGDLDVVSGIGCFSAYYGTRCGEFAYYENTGSATSPAFAERSGSANPLDGFDVENFAAPALADLDADGDLDVFAGNRAGTFTLLRNTGSATSPAFALRSGSANPLAGVGVVGAPSPAFSDLDDDGDRDLVLGAGDGTFAWFDNTGSASSPVFVQRTGTQNPLAGVDISTSTSFGSHPALADLDGDGDFDLVAGTNTGAFHFFENTGSASAPAFTERTGSANPLGAFDAGSVSTPALVDIDADSDLDVFSGEFSGRILYYENTGSATSPAFAERTGGANPLAGFDLGFPGYGGFDLSSPDFGDLDGDGDLDAISGGAGETFFENTGSPTSPAFALRSGSQNPLAGIAQASLLDPALVDIDGDGDLDVFANAGYIGNGTLAFFENGAGPPARLLERTGSANPLDAFDVGDRSAPALGDLDDDGDPDLVAGRNDGTLAWLENTGTAASPAFAERTGSASPLTGVDVGLLAAPALADIDGDGDLDLFVGDLEVGVHFFENTGSATSPAFAQRTGTANPADAFCAHAPAFGDLDGDGDLDALLGQRYGTLFYYENTGSATSPAFVRRPGGPAHPLADIDVGSDSAPALADVDGDGDLDLVVGRYRPLPQAGATTNFLFFENTGSATSPAFERVANPLRGLGTSDRASGAFADLDGDGDADFVAGDADGGFAFVENAPPVALPLPWWGRLGAALALLGSGLRRRRAGAARS